jgi:hypothetical protein
MSDEDLHTRTAFRITINGEPFCEAEDLTTVTMAVDELRGRADTAVHKGSALPVGASFLDDSGLPCRFCGKPPRTGTAVVVRNGAAVCAECLRTGADILGDRPNRSPVSETEL